MRHALAFPSMVKTNGARSSHSARIPNVQAIDVDTSKGNLTEDDETLLVQAREVELERFGARG